MANEPKSEADKLRVRIAEARKLIPLPYSLIVAPVLNQLDAFVEETDRRLSRLERRGTGGKEE